MRLSLILSTVLLFGTHSAFAYVRTTTTTGLPIAWKNPCIQMHIYLSSPPPVLTADQYFDAASKAASVWSHGELACSDVRLTMVQAFDPDPISGRDGKNMIIFRQDSWCPRSGKAACYSPNALALTTIWKNIKTGEIPDTDIEVNAVRAITGSHYEWNDIVAQPGRGIDFQNMLTHELGHVLGLAHNCYTAADDPPSYQDHTGQSTVDCYANNQLIPQVTDATMFPSVDHSDYSRRTLTEDDQAGICAIYPFTHDVCPSSDNPGGCQVTTTPASASPASPLRLALPFLVLAAVFFLIHRHRRQRR